MRAAYQIRTSDGSSYPVLCCGDPAAVLPDLWEARWHQAVVIGDSNTAELFADPLVECLQAKTNQVLKLSFPAGEENKTRATKEFLEDEMLARAIDRSCCVVAVGGGIALDVAGFVAATYLRGVAHINIATSLLAQVDVAVGGKTGVNTRHGKNLIGAFHQPRAALLATDALGSLPEREMRNGLAEVVKHAVLGDAELFGSLEAWSAGPQANQGILPKELLLRCVGIKAEVVAQDEREHGLRQVLNFGHTVAHAIERASDYSIPHGFAVSAGMLVEAHVASQMCGFPQDHLERLQTLLARLGLPHRPQCEFATARGYFQWDKKTRSGLVHCALPKQIGEMDVSQGRWARPVPLEWMEAAWCRLCE